VTVWFEKKLGLGGEADMDVGTKIDYVRALVFPNPSDKKPHTMYT
jgi:hypothetical protein